MTGHYIAGHVNYKSPDGLLPPGLFVVRLIRNNILRRVN